MLDRKCRLLTGNPSEAWVLRVALATILSSAAHRSFQPLSRPLVNEPQSDRSPMVNFLFCIFSVEMLGSTPKPPFPPPQQPTIPQARRAIATMSFARAKARLVGVKRRRGNSDEALAVDRRASETFATMRQLVINSSQFADDRPLSAIQVFGLRFLLLLCCSIELLQHL